MAWLSSIKQAVLVKTLSIMLNAPEILPVSFAPLPIMLWGRAASAGQQGAMQVYLRDPRGNYFFIL
ncbi:hypothetical protein Holit_02098 [Hollandina sp. SP2]